MPQPDRQPEVEFLSFYDEALPHVYGYLWARCRAQALAEDLTAETFLAAAAAARRPNSPPVSLPWVVGVARHKLIDHWRRQARDDRNVELLKAPGSAPDPVDPWEAALDAVRVSQVLEELAPSQRAALILRYFDDLPVARVAALLGRTVHATEALLVRARVAFRAAYSSPWEAPDA